MSSGEAEYYGLVSGASQVLGEQATARDWRVKLTARIWMDATAGIAIGSRKGLGRVKHIDTVFLWVQEMVRSGRIIIGKKGTTEMLADMLTKPLKGVKIAEFMEFMHYRFATGRHGMALQAT